MLGGLNNDKDPNRRIDDAIRKVLRWLGGVLSEGAQVLVLLLLAAALFSGNVDSLEVSGTFGRIGLSVLAVMIVAGILFVSRSARRQRIDELEQRCATKDAEIAQLSDQLARLERMRDLDAEDRAVRAEIIEAAAADRKRAEEYALIEEQGIRGLRAVLDDQQSPDDLGGLVTDNSLAKVCDGFASALADKAGGTASLEAGIALRRGARLEITHAVGEHLGRLMEKGRCWAPDPKTTVEALLRGKLHGFGLGGGDVYCEQLDYGDNDHGERYFFVLSSTRLDNIDKRSLDKHRELVELTLRVMYTAKAP